MKAQLLMLSAAGLLLATAANASPTTDRFIAATRAGAESRLAAEGVDLAGKTLVVQAQVGNGARVASVRVVTSTGSQDLDRKALAALRKLTIDPPTEMIGRGVTLTLGGPAEAPASQ